MTNRVNEVEKMVNEILEDFIITRNERKDLSRLVASKDFKEHERILMLSKMRDKILENTESNQNEIHLFYELSKVLLKTPNHESAKNTEEQVVFSPGTACRSLIIKSIRSAAETIDICVFTISDNEITEAILAAHKKRKKIRIITDNDKTFDKGSDIDELAKASVPVVTDRTDAHMHHKFAIFDGKELLTGSYNWTRSAALYNYENILQTHSKLVVRNFKEEFERLWNRLS